MHALCISGLRRPALALPMHPATIVLGFLGLCVLVCQAFRRCARSQRDVFLDRERVPLQLARTRFSYQALPTTIV